ncbi:MAG: polyribonucleotide nucleotidyltransferase [Clostridiales bacterium]|nr:polyribonucleotide nucleotidyltransferase [Clostridiales bacterium]
MHKIFKTEIAGKAFEVEVGKMALLADGACTVKYGDTVILVTACSSKKPRDGIDFFPLSIEYAEKMYSVGKIPGGFIKREGRPSEKSVLSARLIDRPIRPLFPKGYRNDVQVIASVQSVDKDCAPEILAMIGSSIALSISSIPFMGPTAAVIVGMIDGKAIVNPTSEESEASDLHLVVSGTKDAVMMIEAMSNELTEEQILDCVLLAHDEIKKIVGFIEEIVSEVGKEKVKYSANTIDEDIEVKVREFATVKLIEAIKTKEKTERNNNIDTVKKEAKDFFAVEYEDQLKDISDLLGKIVKEEIRKMILDEGIRPDGRKLDEIREITCEISLLPRTHGTALFTRGQTQVLTVATLGTLGDMQTIDGLGDDESKRYMHHYNFPPSSVGETGFMRGPGRREIGHGALAERALELMIPSRDEFPYTIRLVSEVLSSNGSSSMASVCGSTLAMLDAGVPLKNMVAGIAMGLIKEEEKVAVLSDILGMEDFLGDMDFKVAGTEKGITAIQMDIKIKGIGREILQTALEQARVGRLFILDKMKDLISEPKAELSPYAPKIIQMKIDADKIRDVIGAGGKVINKIIDETGVKIDIENDGSIFISAPDQESGRNAQAIIENIVKDPMVGEVYKGKVIKIMNFGAFVEILPGKEGLVHISHIARERINKVEDVLSEGQEIDVKILEIDPQGKISLSRKVLLPKQSFNERKKEDK